MLLIVFANLFILTDYGEASFVLAGFTLLGVLAQIGVPHALVPYLVKKSKDLNSVAWFLLLDSFFFTVLGLLISFNYPWVLPLVLTLPLLLFYGLGRAVFRSEHKHHLVQITDTLFIFLTFAFVLLLHSKGRDGIILAYAASNALVSIITIWLARRRLAELYSKPAFDLPVIKYYFIKASLIFAIFLSIDVLGRIDSVLLGFLSSYDNVARYNVASSIASIISVIPLSLSMFLLTRSAEVEQKEASESIFNRCLRISFTLSFLLAILLSAFIFLLDGFLFRQYVGIELFVVILSAGVLFNSVYFLFYTYLAGKLRPEKAVLPMVGAAIINIVLDVALIPSLGVYGICIATLAAQVFAFTIFARKHFKLTRLVVPYVAPLFLGVVFVFREFGALLLIPAIFLIIKSGWFDRGDWNVIKETVSKIIGSKTRVVA